MRLLDENPGWLSEDAWVIVQIHPVEYEELHLVHLVEFDQRDYGSTIVVFYAIRSEPATDHVHHRNSLETLGDLPASNPSTGEE